MNNKYLPLLFVVLLGIIAFLFLPFFNNVDLPEVNMSAMGSETSKAKVVDIIEDGEIDLGGTVQRYQVARVELMEGEYQGILMEMDYGKRQVLSSNVYLREGDTVLVA